MRPLTGALQPPQLSGRAAAHPPRSITSKKIIIGPLEVKRCGGGGWLSGGKPCPVGTPAASSVRRDRAILIQRKTSRPVQFELTDQTREAVAAWIGSRRLGERDYLFPSRVHALPHLSTRQYGRIVERWVSSIGLDPKRHGTHSMRRTKAAHIYKKTGNLRAVQLLLGHKKLESTVQYLGIEVDDALAISEQVEL
ncbi:Integrase-like (plasmid) [Sinorhizobium fredii HH103]|uniref:Integrase-like n=1 Tax=Sinorhizobium fredii (strain HH103) TaxID=1117943 RepID=G9AJ44_SINF1|nr:Integrase-like [Sinorhizobium fredii HH103]